MEKQLAKPKNGFITRIWDNGIKRFFCWCGRGIKDFFNLLFQGIKISIVLLIFLFVLYLIKPQESSIYSTFETEGFEITECKTVNMNTDTAYYAFNLNYPTIFDTVGIPYMIIDGQKYTPTSRSGGTFDFIPKDEGGMIYFIAENNEPCIHIQDSGSDVSTVKCLKLEKLNNMPHPSWYNRNDGSIIELEMTDRSGVSIKSDSSFSIYLYGYDVSITGFNKADGTEESEAESDTPLKYSAAGQEFIKIDYPNGGMFVTLGTIKGEDKEGLPTISSARILSPKTKRLEISNIKALSTEKASGNMDVYYNPEPDKHDFMLQDLNIDSKGQTLSASIEIADNDHASLILSGYVNKLTLSGNSLLPDFFNMFKDNAFLPPALLLTIIGGAITLSSKSKKAEKEETKQNKEST